MTSTPTAAPVRLTPARQDEPTTGPAVAELSQELVRLTRATHALRGQLAAYGEPGVEWSTYVLLFHLVREGAQRSSSLAEAVHVDPSTVSRQVGQLVKLGLAERRPDPDDGRACLLIATKAGRRTYAAMQERRDRAFASMVADWPPADVVRLAELLGRLNESFAVHRSQIVDAIAGVRDDVEKHP